MRLPQYAVYAMLILLFVAAAWIRIDRSSRSESLYFKGESATNYRYAYMISQRGNPPQIDKKAAFPEGYHPARVKAMGVEYTAGYLYRLVHYFSIINERTFIRLFTALFFSLMVFIAYGISRILWECQAGALLSAALTAFSVPLIAATDGGVFSHIPCAAVAIGLHLLLILRYLKRPSALAGLAAALTAFAIAALWEGALLYLVVILPVALLSRPLDAASKWRLLLPHLALLIFALFLFPHLRGGESAAHWSYAGYRLKFLFGKPADPAQLPENVRALWTLARSAPSAQTLLALFLPFVLLIPAVIDGLRSLPRASGRPFKTVLIGCAVAVALFLIDRSAIVFAAPALAVLAGPALYAFSKRIAARIAFIALASALIVTQIAFPLSGADLTHRIGGGAGLSPERSSEFIWMSIGDADLNLVTYLSTRTGTRDPFLASPEFSSLILTFAGRTTVVMPGINTAGMIAKSGVLLGALYGDEQELYRACIERGIAYVLYSVDMALDDSRYSPRYRSGAVDLRTESAVFQMHFFPEDLTNFELLYENDSYRVFKVVESARPIFLSDHPPVYQYDILVRNRDDLSTFHDRIVRILSLYALAAGEHTREQWSAATDLYLQCLGEAPQFTRARLGLGSAFLAQKEWPLAKAAFLSIVQYAPDNQEALFGAAFAMYYLEELEDARRYLNILIRTPGDKELVKRARGLRMAIAEKLQESN
jgi:hypothetical protein